MSLVRFRFWARRCSSMVEHQPSKLNTWVRFPSPALKMNILFIMREWLSWWSTTLPRSGSRVRAPSVALKKTQFYCVFFISTHIEKPHAQFLLPPTFSYETRSQVQTSAHPCYKKHSPPAGRHLYILSVRSGGVYVYFPSVN